MSEPPPFNPIAVIEAEAAELRRLLEDARQRCERAEAIAAWQSGPLSRDQAEVLLGLPFGSLYREHEELVSRVLRRWREHRDQPEGLDRKERP